MSEKMKFKRADIGLTADRVFYRTRFSSIGPEIIDIEIDVERALADRDPELRARHEEMAMKERGISEDDIIR